MADRSDLPPQRIGDAERDRAAECLREHLAAGRLTAQEFDDRVTVALTAKTAADLDPLFLDLPEPKPASSLQLRPAAAAWMAQPTVSGAAAPRHARRRPVAPAVVWVVVLMLLVLTRFHAWWLVLIPLCYPMWVARSGGPGGRGPRFRRWP